MDIQKIKKNLLFFGIIFGVCFILFYKPLFSGQPLGLDALGHLSKISYIKLYPFVSWDMSWYSGTLFLKLYSPLFYYLAAIFSDSFFAANLLCFISVFLTSIGIFLLVKYYTKNKILSLFCGLSYLTVLSVSYYWIATANLPYFFALWTIPFSLYFLEKSVAEKHKKDFIFYSIFFFIGILTHILVGFLIGILMITRFLAKGFNLKNLKSIFVYGSVPVLLSGFWFFPFLIYSKSFGGYFGQIPTPFQLFGFEKSFSWGLQAGGIGVLFFMFIPILLIFLYKRLWKNKSLLFFSLFLFVLGVLLFGGLGNHYPFGVDPIRFILPFSILLIFFIGLVLDELKLFSKKVLIVLSIILIVGFIWNFGIISKNFGYHSYYKEDSRYGIMQEVIGDNFPVKNEFTNYRFGTSKFIFGETLNYFLPKVSQTFGYQDVGMLNSSRYYDMEWNIYTSENIDDSFYWLNWFAIKYFESEGLNSSCTEKFENDTRFKQIMNYSGEYDFVLFEYIEAKQIISLVESLEEPFIEKGFQWERPSPDRAIIEYTSIDGNDVILFKESYHQSWKAKDLVSRKKLEIKEVGPGFMAVYPDISSKGVVFYQAKTAWDILGILITLLGVFFLVKVRVHNL